MKNIKRIKNISIIIIGILFLGIIIPKLTVQNLVLLTDKEKYCVKRGVDQEFNNSFQRIALFLGKSAVLDKQGKRCQEPFILESTMLKYMHGKIS